MIYTKIGLVLKCVSSGHLRDCCSGCRHTRICIAVKDYFCGRNTIASVALIDFALALIGVIHSDFCLRKPVPVCRIVSYISETVDAKMSIDVSMSVSSTNK